MRRRKEPRDLHRKTRFETFEEKLALSAQPVGDFLVEPHSGGQLDHHYGDLAPVESLAPVADFNLNLGVTIPDDNGSRGVQTQLREAHDLTGVNNVFNTYGFDGAGQTVAVIDSGIAYDHDALGGGFGTSYRVVGGWDFAENDANPYDDGPSGFHGTHVAGIVGSDDAVHRGVASGADLVALRVFDDYGAGYFSWVEDALNWVHENRNAFENPITTVNLSLGTSWNADSIPEWAMLEDEFAQLERDGIFIAVSAGNSFADYDTPGLSYPAASSHVVPVASVDDTGLLSYFSQRSDRVLAAPGRNITSTVPDHVFGADGNMNDFGAASGTSMAAPYTAGASVLIRQAMEFVGIQNITQDTIYDHFRATADIVYDAATESSYHRINVQAALDALMPGDDYGSTVATAHALGTLSGGTELSGQIGTLADADFFTFVAGATGTASLTVDAHDGLIANCDVVGGGGTLEGNTLSFDVVAGQSYTLSLQSTSGIGRYDAALDIQGAVTSVDWGAIELTEILGQDLSSGETWYQFSASRDGTLTVNAMFDSASGDVDLQLYNAANQLLRSSSSGLNHERIDAAVTQGEALLLRVAGSNSDVDFQVANLVSVNGNTAVVHGTSGDDVFTVVAGQEHHVTVNDIRYSFNSTDVTRVIIDGQEGHDQIIVTGDAVDDTATLSEAAVSLASDTYQIDVNGVERVRLYGGGGNDTATFFDSADNDRFYARANTTESAMMASGYYNYARDFAETKAYSTSGGNDRAEFYDSAGDDRYYARANTSESAMRGTGYYNYARGFDQTFAYATSGGQDLAEFHDSTGSDYFYARAHTTESAMKGTGYYNYARGFEQNHAYATLGGQDRADFYDSIGNDRYYARANTSEIAMMGTGYYNYAKGFARSYAIATLGGDDRAEFYDSTGSDRYYARAQTSESAMMGAGYYHHSRGFSQTFAYSTQGGDDRAEFYDSTGNDHYLAQARTHEASMTGADYRNYTRGFERTYAYASLGGEDRAEFYDSTGNDRYYARADTTESAMMGTGFYNYAQGFERSYAYATHGGEDRTEFYDSAHDDRYYTRASTAESAMIGTGYYNYTRGFAKSQAFATLGGNDRAEFYDSSGNDGLVLSGGRATLLSDTTEGHSEGFKDVVGYATEGGDDTATLLDAAGNESDDLGVLDYLFNQIGSWD